MFEWIEQPWHLAQRREPGVRTFKMPEQPQLLEAGDVPQVPHNGAHQRIVLDVQILVAEWRDQQLGARTDVGQQCGDLLRSGLMDTATGNAPLEGCGKGGHSGPPGGNEREVQHAYGSEVRLQCNRWTELVQLV